MNETKNLFFVLGEWWEARKPAPQQQPGSQPGRDRLLRWLIPNGGTILLALILILTQNVRAKPRQSTLNAPGPSATTVNYQGRLADSSGNLKDGTFGMTFAFYDADTGGSLLWTESHAAVPVSGGLFSVGLGGQTSGGIPTTMWNGDRYLEITVGGETLSPRELIRSVPVAGMALTVPDGAINQDKAPSLIVSAAFNNVKIYFGSSNIAITGTPGGISKTITISPQCNSHPNVYIQPYFSYHSDIVANVGAPWDNGQFTVFLSRHGGGTWSNGQNQGFDWMVICD